MDRILLVLRVAAVLLVLSLPSAAAVIADVRGAIAHNDFKRAAEVLADYRKEHGVDPEYLEALSWLARGKLAGRDLEQANKLAEETEELTRPLLRNADLDEQPHLAIALGAALEVRARRCPCKTRRKVRSCFCGMRSRGTVVAPSVLACKRTSTS